MAKKSKYVCGACGYSQTGWSGKCPECDSWGTLVETLEAPTHGRKSKNRIQIKDPISLSSVKAQDTKRIGTKISELDRVLGGGLVPGQVVLLAGEPGIGKSTLLLQLSDNLGNALYISGEESTGQIKVRADRLGVKSSSINVLEETNTDAVLEVINSQSQGKNRPNVIIIDSIQTMSTRDLSGMAGSVGQVRESAFRLVQATKALGIPLLLVGHATKEGTVAGPATLSHMVDTVCWFEGDKEILVRTLRSVKNRFGPTDEIGLFKMEEKGLISIEESEKMFVSESDKKVPGSAVTCVMEGTRPVLVEIQSLVVPTHTAYPRRIAQGIDSKRLEVILAVIIQRLRLPFWEKDVYISVVGGFNVKEPAADLAVALALVSSFKAKALPKSVSVGELDLSGGLRPVFAGSKRKKQASRQGYKTYISSDEFNNLTSVVSRFIK